MIYPGCYETIAVKVRAEVFGSRYVLARNGMAIYTMPTVASAEDLAREILQSQHGGAIEIFDREALDDDGCTLLVAEVTL